MIRVAFAGIVRISLVPGSHWAGVITVGEVSSVVFQIGLPLISIAFKRSLSLVAEGQVSSICWTVIGDKLLFWSCNSSFVPEGGIKFIEIP